MNMKYTLLALCCAGWVGSGFLPGVALGAERIPVSAKQMQALGILMAPLASAGVGAGAGLPAKVAVPNNQMQVVSAPLAGVIQAMLAAPNDKVKQGQTLARLQSPMLVEAQRNYLQAATEAQLAAQSLKRDDALFKDGIIAEGRYLSTRARNAQAAAALAEQRQTLRLYGMSDGAIGRLQSARGMESSVAITAPFDGVVLEQMATTGQRTDAATPLYTLAKLNPLWLEIQVPASAAAVMAAEARVIVPAFGAEGKVLSVGSAVNPSTQTVTVRASVNQGDRPLRPGQLVEAQVVSAAKVAKQWRVPLSAVAWQKGKPYIFVQTPDGFRPTVVNILGETGDAVVIDGNLQGSEQVAVQGVAALKAAWIGVGEE